MKSIRDWERSTRLVWESVIGLVLVILIVFFAVKVGAFGWSDGLGVIVGVAALLWSAQSIVTTDVGKDAFKNLAHDRKLVYSMLAVVCVVVLPILLTSVGHTPESNFKYLALINGYLLGASLFVMIVQRASKEVASAATPVIGAFECPISNEECQQPECEDKSSKPPHIEDHT